MRDIEVKVIPVTIEVLGTVALKLEKWPQQIPGTMSEISNRKSY